MSKRDARVRLLILLIFLASCGLRDNPESLVSEYADWKWGEKVKTTEEFMGFFTGELLEKYSSMDIKEVQAMIAKNNARKGRIVFHGRECSGDRCLITYSVFYSVIKDSKNIVSGFAKKLGNLVRVDGRWKISSIKNLQTKYDYNLPLIIKD